MFSIVVSFGLRGFGKEKIIVICLVCFWLFCFSGVEGVRDVKREIGFFV